MRRRRWIGLAAVVGVVLVGLFVAVISGRAPALSEVGVNKQPCVAVAESCLTFPAISGQSLPGELFDLPGDFAGKLTLVLVPFDEEQQVKAQTWLPFARDLAAKTPDFTAYNVPVFPSMAAPMRALIRAGMNLTIPDAALRDVTITVFLDDRDQFLSALNIPDTDVMQVLLLDETGVVVWRGAGEFSSPQGDSLRAAVVVHAASVID